MYTAVEMAEHANGGHTDAPPPATAVKDATAAPAPGGREVDFKKLSQPEAFKLLKARHCPVLLLDTVCLEDVAEAYRHI